MRYNSSLKVYPYYWSIHKLFYGWSESDAGIYSVSNCAGGRRPGVRRWCAAPPAAISPLNAYRLPYKCDGHPRPNSNLVWRWLAHSSGALGARFPPQNPTLFEIFPQVWSWERCRVLHAGPVAGAGGCEGGSRAAEAVSGVSVPGAPGHHRLLPACALERCSLGRCAQGSSPQFLSLRP